MTVKEAAARLEVSPATIYAMITAGKLGHRRVGLGRGVIRISEEQLSAFSRRWSGRPSRRSPPLPPDQASPSSPALSPFARRAACAMNSGSA